MYEKKEMKKGRGFNSLHQAMSERFGSGNDPFFDFSNRRFEPREEKVRVVYVPVKQPTYSRSPNQPYTQRPMYAPRQTKQVNVVKEIGSAIKAVKKFNYQRRQSKINEVANLKKDIKQRLEVLKAKNELDKLKKAQRALKTAKQREAISKAREGVVGVFGFVKRKINPGVYGGTKKVSLPKANLPSDANEKM